jgi:hypothetical protein
VLRVTPLATSTVIKLEHSIYTVLLGLLRLLMMLLHLSFADRTSFLELCVHLSRHIVMDIIILIATLVAAIRLLKLLQRILASWTINRKVSLVRLLLII